MHTWSPWDRGLYLNQANVGLRPRTPKPFFKLTGKGPRAEPVNPNTGTFIDQPNQRSHLRRGGQDAGWRAGTRLADKGLQHLPDPSRVHVLGSFEGALGSVKGIWGSFKGISDIDTHVDMDINPDMAVSTNLGALLKGVQGYL